MIGSVGHSSLDGPKDFVDIPIFAVQALAQHGWAEVDVASIAVSDTSGVGGCKTYKVACSSACPPVVALHCRGCGSSKIREDRIRAATLLFSSHGLCPARLLEGKDWWIEVWEGQGKPDVDTPQGAAELGRLLACIHRIPTSWFDDWRAKFCANNPILQSASDSNSVWWASDFFSEMLAHRNEAFQLAFIGFADEVPLSAVARKVVTCHGDFHANNVVQLEQSISNGLKAIDLEFTCAMMAGYDLSVGAFMALETNKLRRVFLQRYLQDMDLPSSLDDVEDLLFDAFLCAQLIHNSRYTIFRILDMPASLLKGELEAVQLFMKRAVQSAELRAAIIAKGFEPVVLAECLELRKLRRQNVIVDVGVSITCNSKLRDDESERHTFKIHWDGVVQICEDECEGMVLGVDEADDAIILMSYSDKKDILKIRMDGCVPVTGLKAPRGRTVPLLLREGDAGFTSADIGGAGNVLALVISTTDRIEDYGHGRVGVGKSSDAVRVYFEDGHIRHAELPYKLLDCSGAIFTPGTKVHFCFGHGGDCQKFKLNEDMTVSPMPAPEVVLGIVDNGSNGLVLVAAGSKLSVHFDCFKGLGNDEALFHESAVSCAGDFKLVLESHPGRAIVLGEKLDDYATQLSVGNTAKALSVVLENSCLRVSDSLMFITAGIPPNELLARELRDIKRAKIRPDLGGSITCKPEQRGKQCQFIIHWDGAVQIKHKERKGMILGVDAEDGAIVLTSYSDTKNSLRVRMDGSVPVTGLRAPRGRAVPLRLLLREGDADLVEKSAAAGVVAGSDLALIIFKTGTHEGFVYEALGVGQTSDAVTVYFEDGYIRHAERPYKMLECDSAIYKPSTVVTFRFGHGQDHQKFKLNEDMTLSPVPAPQVVLGISRVGSSGLILVDVGSKLALHFDCFRGLDDCEAIGKDSAVTCAGEFQLVLESHPGRAIVLGERLDGQCTQLCIGETGNALSVVLEDARLRVSGTRDFLSCGTSLPSQN